MMTLKYEDLSKRSSYTCRVFIQMENEIQQVQKKLNRMKEFDTAMTDKLQSLRTITREEFYQACALCHHTDMTVAEIMEEVFEKKG
jgi:phosphoribosyl-ATP pyrophosphohydrolase